MALATVLLLTTHLIAPHPLQIDFRLSPTGPQAGQAVVTRPLLVDPATESAGSRTNTTVSPRRARPSSDSFTQARGFGADVPLSFAARQIVPDGLRVRYGSEIETDALVSRVGGKPWNRVLQDAIRPLGLRMTLAGGSVTITR
jgi:hypothetical protein